MELDQKLGILAAAAKYDVSCSSSGSTRTNSEKGLGDAAVSGICHSWSGDGRCISLLKVLLSNYCIYDCAYCINRRSNDIPRSAFTVDEVVKLTIDFYRRNYIEGLFLSSGVLKNTDYTMELMVRIAKELRLKHNFHGYIHLKAIPGASRELLRRAGFYADRLSANIELPSEQGLKLLAPDKSKENIFNSFTYLSAQISRYQEESQFFSSTPRFAPAGQSTQMIVGATPESDYQIVSLAEGLYQKFHLKRVYYSAYVPVNHNSLLPALSSPPLKRENRLYQADWLLRFYGFQATELLDPREPFLDRELDPKTSWALRNMTIFPVEVNRAEYEILVRVPGVGLKSAKRIINARRYGPLGFDNLGKLGVVLKRARYFLTCQGRYLERIDNPILLRQVLSDKERKVNQSANEFQLPLFEL
ncbi:MAG: putative DNA modification/repair radical SAM protein [Firmicutes bacterium]|nr:putative DNA modification/repair radical SAM protein [Bacillota bacterium]